MNKKQEDDLHMTVIKAQDIERLEDVKTNGMLEDELPVPKFIANSGLSLLQLGMVINPSMLDNIEE